MKIRFLIHNKKKLTGDYELICPGGGLNNISIEAATCQDGIELIEIVLKKYLDVKGTAWVKRWKSSGNIVNCPEAYIDLPSDIWKCKLNKTVCGLQAQVLTDQKQIFFDKCHAKQKRKENILAAIQGGKYDGFHHVPGRFLCVQCAAESQKKINERYHYPWGLVSLSSCLELAYSKEEKINRNDDFDKVLKKNGYMTLEAMLEQAGFEGLAAANAICSSCCKKIISNIFSEISEQFRIIEVEFFGR